MTTESASVILSVENCQAWLASAIRDVIECLADLTARFEIIVVDNASRDYTVEILEDMSCRFPQVRFRRFSEQRSLDEAVDCGLSMATGEFLFTTTPGSPIDPNDLRRLWALRSDPRLLVARSRTTARRIDASLIARLTNWAGRVTAMPEPVSAVEGFGGLQMMRRQAIAQLKPAQSEAIATTVKPNGHSKRTDEPASASAATSTATSAAGSAQIEISHISHHQLASPKLVEARRRTLSKESGHF